MNIERFARDNDTRLLRSLAQLFLDEGLELGHEMNRIADNMEYLYKLVSGTAPFSLTDNVMTKRNEDWFP